MIYTSERADSKLEIPNVSITEYALRHADRLADKPALIDGPSGRTLTFGQLADGIKAVAGGLHARGFRKGDVLAIYCPNMPEYALVFNAVASVGGINTTVNPLYTAAELAKQLNDANAKFFWCSTSHSEDGGNTLGQHKAGALSFAILLPLISCMMVGYHAILFSIVGIGIWPEFSLCWQDEQKHEARASRQTVRIRTVL